MISPRTSDTEPSAMVRSALMAKPRRKLSTVERLEHVVREGLRGGYCTPLDYADRPDLFRRRFRLNLDMDCEDPFEYELFGRYDRRNNMTKAIVVEVRARCRKCAKCMERKRMFWRARALTEFDKAPNSYMVTLTLSPEMHYHFDGAVRAAFSVEHAEQASAGCLASATLFNYRARVVGAEVTKYLKRIRKRAPFRYLQVAEAHQNEGLVFERPHFHLLIHEVKAGTLVLPTEVSQEDGPCRACGGRFHKAGEVCDSALLRASWEHGFTKAMLGDRKSVYYLCKYISKEMATRVRASISYGDDIWSSPKAHYEKGNVIRNEDEGEKLTPRRTGCETKVIVVD